MVSAVDTSRKYHIDTRISEIRDGAANSDDTSEPPTAIADATIYNNEDEIQREGLEEPEDASGRGGPMVAQSRSHSRGVSPCSSHTGHTIEVTDSNSHSGGASHSDEVTSIAQGFPDQSEMRDERSIVGLSHSSYDETKQVAPPAKRALSDGGHPSSSSSEECSFFLSKSTKNRGRPKIRKNQKQQVKKQRLVNSLKEAKQLVQGTLTPVITLSNVATVLKSTYSYESAYEFLSKLSVKTLGPRKQVIAKMVAPSEALSSVKFVFTEQFTHKCRNVLETYREALPDPKSPVGVRLAKIGFISEDQVQVMVEYHHTMKSLEAVSDTIEWMEATSLNRLDIPEGLNEYVELDKTKATTALQQIVLPISRLTPFGMVSNESVLLLREDLWLNDDCMMHVMTTIQEEHAHVGIISPGVTGTDDPETQEKVISGSDPFQEHNTHVLLPIHINRNHWCGAVFDFKSTPNRITVFDPQQKPKQLETCEDIVKKIFPEIVAKMDWKREVWLKQTDGHNCGPLVLLFFESIVRDVVLPKSPSKALLRYYRMRYLLKSLHV
ncbi:hypothetical protein PInf_008390 [Phytophthora infestans]|nr:hypothetical protein PInf_008390 [Phytophthora infestans]